MKSLKLIAILLMLVCCISASAQQYEGAPTSISVTSSEAQTIANEIIGWATSLNPTSNKALDNRGIIIDQVEATILAAGKASITDDDYDHLAGALYFWLDKATSEGNTWQYAWEIQWAGLNEDAFSNLGDVVWNFKNKGETQQTIGTISNYGPMLGPDARLVIYSSYLDNFSLHRGAGAKCNVMFSTNGDDSRIIFFGKSDHQITIDGGTDRTDPTSIDDVKNYTVTGEGWKAGQEVFVNGGAILAAYTTFQNNATQNVKWGTDDPEHPGTFPNSIGGCYRDYSLMTGTVPNQKPTQVYKDYGGAIFIQGKSVGGETNTVNECAFYKSTIKNNSRVGGMGGGISFYNGIKNFKGAYFNHCVISGNRTSAHGGGVNGYLDTPEDGNTEYGLVFKDVDFNYNIQYAGVDEETGQEKQAEAHGGAVFFRSTGRQCSFEDCSFTGNYAAGTTVGGGAISTQGNTNIKNCTFMGNVANNSFGGAISANPITGSDANTRVLHLTVDGCTFDGNTCTWTNDLTTPSDPPTAKGYNSWDCERGSGGAILLDLRADAAYSEPTTKSAEPPKYEVTLTVKNNCVFRNNHADRNGGAIAVEMTDNLLSFLDHVDIDDYVESSVTIESGIFAGNTSGKSGATWTNASTYYTNENFPHENGGALYLSHTSLSVTGNSINIDFSGNEATSAGNGGAIAIYDGDITINGGVFGKSGQPNKAVKGGAIYLEGSKSLTMNGGSICYNQATGKGGGIYMGASMNMADGDFLVRYNKVGDSDNNVYLPIVNGTPKTITVTGAANPSYMGIYTESTTTPIPIMTGTSAYLEPIYEGMLIGTMNIVDDRQTYSPEYTEGQTTLYLGDNPWSMLQRAMPSTFTPIDGVYQIGNVQQLTAFLLLSNGIKTCGDFKPDPATDVNGVLTADINMTGQYWVPIGTSATGGAFAGTLDGNGHTISGLSMVANNASDSRGLFGYMNGGTVRNLVMKDCEFIGKTGGSGYIGSIASQMTGGIVSSCCVEGGSLVSNNSDWKIGGLVGKAEGTAEVHSSASFANMNGYLMGGLVGELASGASLKNSMAYPKCTAQDINQYVGLLAATNAGTVENCYVREQAGSSNGNKFGWFVGSNTGTISYCYAPTGTTNFVNAGNTPSGHGTYGGMNGTTPYQYKQRDFQITLASGQTNPYMPNQDPHQVTNPDKQLTHVLKNWVAGKNRTAAGKYSSWFRPTTTDIFGDYPIVKLGGFNSVAASGSTEMFEYGMVNSQLSVSGNTVCFYGSENAFTDYNGDKLYIDEDAALKQSSKAGTITATVGITLDNSAGANGANPSQGGTDAIDWHFFSTSLSDAPLGIDYTIDGVEDVNVYEYEDPIPQYRHTGAGYFPTGVNSYYDEWDFYAYREPEYHWINFKRNSVSHWDEMAPWINIPYNNNSDSKLTPGMGYMVALADETLLQCTGTLNQGLVGPISLSCEGFYRKGLNLLGNPYQSYLDFEIFASNNNGIWPSGENATTPYYIIMDEDQRDYVAYAVGQSPNTMTAGRYIHPHQGFMVVAGKPVDANFTDDMRVTDVGSYDAHFRDQQVAYPLVNLIATDANGNRDIATAELGRPDKGGAILADFATLANCLVYVHYDDKDYRIAFTQPGITSLPVRFVAFENGTYTLTWDTENGEFGYMHLIDNITGTDVDMLTAQEYTFTASTDDLLSRFKLVFAYTGIGEDENTVTNANFAFMSNGQLVVEGEGMLQLIDMNGRVLHHARLHGDVNTVDLPQIATGLYVLKLDERTQKIVLE